jgi:hypothetical protein
MGVAALPRGGNAAGWNLICHHHGTHPSFAKVTGRIQLVGNHDVIGSDQVVAQRACHWLETRDIGQCKQCVMQGCV